MIDPVLTTEALPLATTITTTSGTTTTKPADTTKPATSLAESQINGNDDKTGWEVIADEIDDADDGDRIVVDMNGTTEVSKSIIEQIKDKNIDLVIELDNGFTWIISGDSVTKPMDIDLGVNEGVNIPIKVINEVIGECSYISITLTHNGDFGFTATLTEDMGDDNKGFYANLYWYAVGEMKFVYADKISSKGKAYLTFTHASEYVIVIDKTNHGKRVEESDNADSDVDNVITEEDDDFNPFIGVAISFSGVIISVVAVLLTKKRRK